MSQVNTNAIYDASGGQSAQLYGVSMRYGGTNFVNRIINGDMRIDQRNNGASVTPTSSGNYYLDRWAAGLSQASKFSIQQSSTAPAGFTKSILITSLSAYTVGSGESFTVRQPIEGFNCADLAWGTASAQPVTLSFQVRSSLTGTFGGAINNSGNTRSYPFSYTISSANTWETKTITIAGDTSGTWLTDNSLGMMVVFGLGVGSTLSGTAGSWAGANYLSATGATSVVGTSGATFYITGVQLEAGSVATPFERRPYGTELALCQRYLIAESMSIYGLPGFVDTTTSSLHYLTFRQTMRAAPTLTTSGTFEVRRGGIASSPATIAGLNTLADGARVTTSSSSLTTGQGVGLTASTGTAIMFFSAEL